MAAAQSRPEKEKHMQTPAKVTVVLVVAAGIFFAGYMTSRQTAPAVQTSSAKQVLYYACPMHPQYRSDHPGSAPCCGMRLEPVYADPQPGEEGQALPGGAVVVSAVQQQLIGVRTDEVKRSSASHVLRLPGRITVDEARLFRLIAAVDGWIEELGHNPAGTFVKKGEVLASYYTANLQADQQSLLFAAANTDQLTRGQVAVAAQHAPVPLNLQVAVDALRTLGMSDAQINKLQQTNQYQSQIDLYAPVSGFVLARNVSPEQRFDKGTEMYRIADISHLWVTADIFEKDRQFLKPGAMATVRYGSMSVPARMTDTLQQLDPQARTLKTRFELDNPGNVSTARRVRECGTSGEHAAGDHGAVRRGHRRGPPQDGVRGSRATGISNRVRSRTGWRLGDRVQITEGLEPGEHIVVSSNFLIDSESRMRLSEASAPAPMAHAKSAAAEKDPVCGMDVDPKAPKAIQAQYHGKTYTFCSEKCKRDFVATPEKYAPKKQMAAR